MKRSVDVHLEDNKNPYATQEGVTVCTWGTSSAVTSGVPKLISDTLYGTNVGHAAIMLSLKNNEENLKMVKKYCDKVGIPYAFRNVTVPSIKYQKDDAETNNLAAKIADGTLREDTAKFEEYKSTLLAQGKIIVRNNSGEKEVVRQMRDNASPAYQEELINVYFSWWPGVEGRGFALNSDMFADNMEERKGVPVEYSDIAKAMSLEPEHRILTGLLKKLSLGLIPDQEATLSPKNIEHLSSLPKNIASLFSDRKDIDEEIERHELYKLVLNKIPETEKGSIILPKNTFLILKYLLRDELTEFLGEKEGEIKDINNLRERLLVNQKELYLHIKKVIATYLTDLFELNKGVDVKYKGNAAIYQMKMKKYSEYADSDGPIRKLFHQYISNQAGDFPMELSKFVDDYLNLLKDNNIKHNKEFVRELFQLEHQMNGSVDKKTIEEVYRKGLQRYLDQDIIPFRVGYYSLIRNELEKPILREYLNLALTTGLPPDHNVEIPLDTSGKHGVSPERLLAAMNEFVSSQKAQFNIVNNNCSVAACQVLAKSSGEIGDRIFCNREYSGIATPQLVYSNAAHYLEILQNPNHLIVTHEDSVYIKARNYVVETALDGISKLHDEESSTLQRVGGVLKALATVPALVAIGIKETVSSSESNYTATEKPEEDTKHQTSSTARLVEELGGRGNVSELSTDQRNQRTPENPTKSEEKKGTQQAKKIVDSKGQDEEHAPEITRPRW